MDFRICPHCHMKVALTKQNPTGVCPAFNCPEYFIFNKPEEELEKCHDRIELDRKYHGLYLSEGPCSFHFLYALNDGKLVFIENLTLFLYVMDESNVHKLAKSYYINNLRT